MMNWEWEIVGGTIIETEVIVDNKGILTYDIIYDLLSLLLRLFYGQSYSSSLPQ